MEEELFLGFIKLVGEESDGLLRYEFIFTDNPDEFWGEDFNVKPAGLCNDLTPSDEYITEIHTVRTKLKFDLIQDSCCFSFADAQDGIVALAWENIDTYEEYPEERGRLYFKFGETYDTVEATLARANILMSE